MEKQTKPDANKEFFNGFDDDILNPDDFKDPEEKGKDNPEDKGKEKDKDDKSKSNPNPDNKELDKPKDEGTDKDKSKTENKDGNPEDKEKQKSAEEKELEKKNAYYAELRRKREAEEKAKLAKEREDRDKQIREKATVEGKLSVLKTNPYTEEPINDEEDLKEYEIMRELEKSGKDPVKDYPKEVANRNRIAKQKADELEKSKADADAKQQEKAKKEVEEFSKLHPDVDLNKLAADAEFQKFAGDKFGRWTLDEIYSSYIVKNPPKDNTNTDDEKAKELAKKQTKTPNPDPTGKEIEKDFMSMTDEEYKAYQKKKNPQEDFF